jgi:WD40 repeat protein
MSAIFLSHSSADKDAAASLHDWLLRLGYASVFLDFDPEAGIPPGRDWEKELYAQLRTSRAVIVLCSGSSMASPWCFAEITHARALGKALFPLKVADCEIHALLRTVQVIDLTERREEGLDRLLRGLKAAGLDPANSFDWDGSRPPYPGLLAFEEADAAVFFGRENEIRDALDALSRQRRFGGSRFMLLLGASGSGKSSLLRAGILPRLRRNPSQWIIVPPFRPLGRPFESLAYVLANSFEQAGEKRDWHELLSLMAAAPPSDAPARWARELSFSMHRPEATVLVCVDQLEELFTLGGAEEADRFLVMLRRAAESAGSQILIVATVRSDFLGAVQTQATLREVSFTELLVNPMSMASVGEIIEGPAAVANLEFEPGLVRAMLQDTEAEGALPLLAFTLRELWEHRTGDKLMLREYRDQLGGLTGSVARAAEGVLSGRPAMSAQEETELHQAFLSLVRINDEGRFTRRPAHWADLSERVHPLLEQFVQARLLVSHQDVGGRMLEVAHEALLSAWGRLAAWLNQDRAFLFWRRRLDQALDSWVANDKSREWLLTGAFLRESKGQLKEHGEPLSHDEKALISASIAADRRSRISRKAIAAGVAAALILSGTYALWQARVANEQHHLTVARQLAAEARVALEQGGESASELERSLLLATASLKFAWTEDGIEAWSNALELLPPRPTVILGPEEGPYTAVTFTPDGSRLAVAGKASIMVMDSPSLTGGTPPKMVARLAQAGVTALAFRPPDGQIVVGGAGQAALVWSVSGQQQVKELPESQSRFDSMAFDSQGKRFASVGLNYYARVFETEGWTEIGWVGNVPALGVAFSPDDRWLLTAGPKVVAWDLAVGMRHPGDPSPTPNPESSVVVDENGRSPYFLSFGGDGRWLAASGGFRSVTASDAGQKFSVTDRFGFSSSAIVAVNSDASLVATGGSHDEVAIWRGDLERKEFHQVGRIRPDRTKEGRSTVAFAPTGKWLISAADRLERWDLAAGAEWQRLQHGAGVLDVAVSPNARFVATTTVDGSARVWDTNTWREIFKDEVHRTEGDAATSNLAFSADGRWLAATSQNVVKIFSTGDWHQAFMNKQGSTVERAIFSPDSKWLVLVENRGQELTLMAVNSWQTSHFVHGTKADAVSISPDGRQFLTLHDPHCQRAQQIPGLAQVWEISGGPRQRAIPLADNSLPCSPSGRETQDGTPDGAQPDMGWRAWKRISVDANPPSELASQDGAWIVTHGFSSDSIELRRSSAGDRPRISHRAGGVNSMAMSPNARWLVTTSSDGVARVWALARETMILQSCARLTHDLSRDDWRRHFGDEPYSPVCPELPPRQPSSPN